MQTAEINWRPLGELFVEQGLLSREELEDALSEQSETHARLGEILMSRGLVSGHELTRVLVDQLGRKLEKDGEPRSSTLDRGERENARAEQRGSNAVPPPSQNGSTDIGYSPGSEGTSPQSAFEAALVKEREALEAALNERRAALQATFAEVPTHRQPDPPALTPVRTPDSEDIVNAARDQMEALNARLAALEASFADERRKHSLTLGALEASVADEQEKHRRTHAELEAERSGHHRVLQELDQARNQARNETSELRSSLERLRAELARLDETTSWFEYWSGGAASPTGTAEGPSTGG